MPAGARKGMHTGASHTQGGAGNATGNWKAASRQAQKKQPAQTDCKAYMLTRYTMESIAYQTENVNRFIRTGKGASVWTMGK